MTPPCAVCGAQGAAAEEARVHSNVRAFREEVLAVWRCGKCACIHAGDEVDLSRYYEKYPCHGLPPPRRLRRLHRIYCVLLRRMAAAGLTREHRVLDYGCGGGQALSYLERRGFTRVSGFDEYNERFRDRGVLENRFDLVLMQDVLEHVPEPRELLRDADGLVDSGGLLVIGTPNAEAVDLARPEAFRHTLHQPYHRHIFSREALLDAGRAMGWETVRFYPFMYLNTPYPCVNQRFLAHYIRCSDDTGDAFFDPPPLGNWRLYTPRSIFLALFGSLHPPRTDMMVIFRKGGGKSSDAGKGLTGRALR